ncbi:MAG: hypothetical protein ACKOF9_04130 [Burkholderiales bacterium]
MRCIKPGLAWPIYRVGIGRRAHAPGEAGVQVQAVNVGHRRPVPALAGLD